VNSVFEAFSHLNCGSYVAAFWGGNFGGNYKFSGGGAGCAKTVHSYFKEEGRGKREEGRRKREEGRRQRIDITDVKDLKDGRKKEEFITHS
jgi:hypothetical protein